MFALGSTIIRGLPSQTLRQAQGHSLETRTFGVDGCTQHCPRSSVTVSE